MSSQHTKDHQNATMDTTSPPPLASLHAAHTLIRPYIHRTPVLTSTTLSNLASTPNAVSQPSENPKYGEPHGTTPSPKIRLFFKCENMQRTGAFKVRGAFTAVGRAIERLGIEEVRGKGVITHSSGNHAQALALAAKTFDIPAHIVMPTISTPSKIVATQASGAKVYFSGSTSQERQELVDEIIRKTGALLIPPYDHPDIISGQGTIALEAMEQVDELLSQDPSLGVHGAGNSNGSVKGLDAFIFPCGGGGMLAGNAIALHETGIRVFGAEPSFEGADDARRGVEAGSRIVTVKTLTIADGLRTPLGEITWKVVSDGAYVQGLYSVTEEQIKKAMKLVLERMKVFVEPSAVVGLAVVLYNEEFREMVARKAGEDGWNVGIVFSGGNTTVEAITKIFADVHEGDKQRAEGVLAKDGKKVAENVAG